MITYTCICLRNGALCYQKVKALTHDELFEQYRYWSVCTLRDLLQAWNRQPESAITKLKWIYF
jgi:hypothetical protein